MSAEFDYDLSPDQWEALRTLRSPSPSGHLLGRYLVQTLVGLHLAVMIDDCPVITPHGRKVLVRGSSRLLDVAA